MKQWILFGSFGALLMVLSLNPSSAEGRVFRINNEKFAVILSSSSGASSLKQTHFEGTSGTGVSFADTVSLNQTYEFGILFNQPGFGIKLSYELISPASLTEALGKNASQVTLVTMGSYISAAIPKLGFEVGLGSGDIWRFQAFGSYGMGSARISNSYELSTAGQAAFPGVSNFTDESKGTSFFYEVGLSGEILMSDSTTIILGLGYRKLEIQSYKYSESVTNFTGTHSVGDAFEDSSGHLVTSDFGGPFAVAQFRFYLR